MERIIFHVDVNSAYLSWEAARRIKDGKTDIRTIPSAIGGDRDKRGKGVGRVCVEGKICRFNARGKSV